MADGVGFEPTRDCPLAVFKTAAFNRSATRPSADASRASWSRAIGQDYAAGMAITGFASCQFGVDMSRCRTGLLGAALLLGAAPMPRAAARQDAAIYYTSSLRTGSGVQRDAGRQLSLIHI